MINLILSLIALYLVILAVMIFVPCITRTSSANGKKITFDFSPLNTSFIISRILWSFVGFLALVYCITLIYPLLWMFYTSIKQPIDYTINSFSLPNFKNLYWDGYRQVNYFLTIREGTKTYGIGEMLFNSLYNATVGPLVGMFWITVVAYVMARFKFVGNAFIYNLGILIMMVPIVGSTAAAMIFKQKIGLYDQLYISCLVPPATPFSGMQFMVIYSALKAIPKDYSDAARIDGANEYGIMFKIIIPMVIPTCATFFILNFISAWNTYESFLVWYPSTPNLMFGMWKFQSGTGASALGATTPDILAGFVVCMIPTMVLYLSAQKLITSKFTVGGLKG